MSNTKVDSQNIDLKYKRPDIENGFITNQAEIEYYKQVQVNEILNNYMLGDYNENGNYLVKKDIIDELLKITKLMQHTYGKAIFCTSAIPIKDYDVLEFAVKIIKDKPKNNFATATLELLEPIDKAGGYYQNINTVLIAFYSDKYDQEFLEKVYKAFNIIINKDEYKGRKRRKEDISNILDRKDYLKALDELSAANMNMAEKKFYDERIKALKESGKFGKEILDELNSEIEKISKSFLKPSSPKYYSILNQLVDKVIETKDKNLMDKSIIEKLEKIQDKYIKASEKIIENAKQKHKKAQKLPENIEIVEKQIKEQKEIKVSTAKQKVVKLEKKDVEVIINNESTAVSNTDSFDQSIKNQTQSKKSELIKQKLSKGSGLDNLYGNKVKEKLASKEGNSLEKQKKELFDKKEYDANMLDAGELSGDEGDKTNLENNADNKNNSNHEVNEIPSF